MKNKRVVITGSAGFIGPNLAHELAIDNTVNPDNLRRPEENHESWSGTD